MDHLFQKNAHIIVFEDISIDISTAVCRFKTS
jgi:hypothetical protein